MARTRLPSGGIGLLRLIWLGALTCAGAPAVWAQAVTSDYPIAGMNCAYMRNSSSPEDSYYACYGQRPTSPQAPVPTVDPCFIAQNAMRPCKPKLVGVDPETIGRWKVQQKSGPWVWEIDRNGAYKFHSEAGDGVRTHEGKFVASKGRWSLKATSGFTDSGTYRFQSSDTWIVTGNWGTVAYRLDAAKASFSKPAPPVPTKSQSPSLRLR